MCSLRGGTCQQCEYCACALIVYKHRHGDARSSPNSHISKINSLSGTVREHTARESERTT